MIGTKTAMTFTNLSHSPVLPERLGCLFCPFESWVQLWNIITASETIAAILSSSRRQPIKDAKEVPWSLSTSRDPKLAAKRLACFAGISVRTKDTNPATHCCLQYSSQRPAHALTLKRSQNKKYSKFRIAWFFLVCFLIMTYSGALMWWRHLTF
jgi:hypothetical protein